MVGLFADCIVPGCYEPADADGEPCPGHLEAAAELFAWSWPNGLPPTISKEEAERRRTERAAAAIQLVNEQRARRRAERLESVSAANENGA